MMLPKLAIVVPCYNESEVIHETTKRLTEFLKGQIEKNKVSNDSFVLFVDDGSKDTTWNLIEEFNRENKYINGLKLAGNVGHQNALMAGLMKAKDVSDISVSIDADLQDDIETIGEMVDKYHEGYEIVYGVRSERKTDTFFKRTTAQGFYKVMAAMGVKTVYNHADFRLMSKKVLEDLAKYQEKNLFIRGLIPIIGYKSTSVYYERHERFAGESKYPLKKMLNFAFEGITSFSTTPIRFVTSTGFFIVIASLIAIIYSLISYFSGHNVPGWTSVMLSIWILGGIQIMAVGLIGEYVGKVYIETKSRPRYNIEKYLG